MYNCVRSHASALLTRPPIRTLVVLARNMATGGNEGTVFKNRLSKERSPYLLQHASNPVDWYPWGDEAFEKARREDKVIFLSVGYSTCHWCHVMERESFEDEEIGKILNEHFVSIKVDREERPDVDRVYMTFIQATSGGGGWPMSVWLTPDLKPLTGGTYFAPTDRFGRPGFATILKNIASQWTHKKEDMKKRGSAILDALVKNTAVKQTETQPVIGQEAIDTCYDQLKKGYDPQYGGFGDAPKFPQPVNFNFMFRYYNLKQMNAEKSGIAEPKSQKEDPSEDASACQGETREGSSQEILNMCLHTLKMMAKGGMNDHIGLGFHRYSTDRYWHVPHFEKMLYDQAQLAISYLDAYQLSKDEGLADVARDILTYVDRDLSDTAGGFYSAEDADSLPTQDSKGKKEGAFCVWKEKDLGILLSETLPSKPSLTLAKVFIHHYGVHEYGNVSFDQDPHGELKGQNVLIVRGSVAKTAEQFGLDEETAACALRKAKDILFQKRLQRPKPHLDDKMITAWNGLMVSAYARAGQVLRDDWFTSRAAKAAEFIKQELYDVDDKKLYRTAYREDEKAVSCERPKMIAGFVDDYAFLIRGLLDLYEASYDEQWIEWAEALQTTQNKLFWDGDGGGGYFSVGAQDPNILLRLKEDQDGAEPSPNSVSALNLLRLADYLDHEPYRDQARALLNIFHERLQKIPIALPEMTCALINLQNPAKQIFVCGGTDADDTKELLEIVHSHFIPNKILVVTDGNNCEYLSKKLKVLSTLERKQGKATAYVCENYTCTLPVNSPTELERILTGTK